MPDRLAIYRNDAKTYDLLISREDHEGNLLKALRSICDFSGKDIADLGAGTGRLALLLAPSIRSALLTDNAGSMLDVAKEKLMQMKFTHFSTHVCDIGTVPADDASFDVALAGWALISVALRADPWQEAVRKAVGEIQRVLRPCGTIILIESMGTGQEYPKPRISALPTTSNFWKKTVLKSVLSAPITSLLRWKRRTNSSHSSSTKKCSMQV